MPDRRHKRRTADPPVRRWVGRLVGAALVAAAPSLAAAQLAPPSTGGVVALDRLLQQVAEQRRVLLIAAHPDDEDTELLALLSLGYGAQAAYLSLNRGEGGQNLIGPELGPQLGIIRSRELLSAREIDGATQFFTRTFDYGFSRTLDEAQRFWPSDSVLKDVVRIIRRFRPQVIVSVFSGTPRDGHGQHQDAGWVAPLAFAAAADPARFPELKREEGLDPWQALKFYRGARFNRENATLTLPAGGLDPRLGKSYYQIAMASRSRHRSQDMGQLQRIGPDRTGVQLIESKVGSSAGGAETSLFDGIPNGVEALARWADSLRGGLSATRMSEVATPIAATLQRISGSGSADRSVRRSLEEALAVSAGLVMDAVTTVDEVIPGQRFEVDLTVYNAGPYAVGVDSMTVSAPAGWKVEALGGAATAVESQQVTNRKFAVTVADSARPTQPYFLEKPLRGAMYDWSGAPPAVRGLPFQPPPVNAAVALSLLGAHATLNREVTYRVNEQAVGEIRRGLRVVPAIEVALDPDRVVWPATGDSAKTFVVTLTSNGAGKRTGIVRLDVPPGWRTPAPQRFAFERANETSAFRFDLARPRGVTDAALQVRALAEADDGRTYGESVVVVDYPHIRATPYVRQAASEVRVAPLQLAQVRKVGYIRGASDRVPEALLGVGVPLTLLSADDLARGDLSQYDAIVVGSRAYETDSALTRSNGRLLDYARAGGLVVVQYQQYAFVRGGYAALPLTIANPHDRVTDENAPVKILDPTDRALTRPNRIVPTDWDGWPQERGLYFAHTWDPAYKPLLEMNDPGMEPLDGGLLIGKYGRGTYVYTGLAFFRFLPAGVPGAFKLFLNLLSLQARDAS